MLSRPFRTIGDGLGLVGRESMLPRTGMLSRPG